MKMNIKVITGLLMLSASCSLMTAANAEEDKNIIIFTGTVSDTTCTAAINGDTETVELGTTSVDELKAYNFGAPKAFSFSLTGCPTAAGSKTNARVTFGGEADLNNSDYFKNQASTDPATGVAVAIFDAVGQLVKINNESDDVDISSGSATIPFTAKLAKSGPADPTKGTVKTTVTYNVTYY